MWLRLFIGLVTVIGLMTTAQALPAHAIPETRPGPHSTLVKLQDLRAKVKALQRKLDRLQERLESSTLDDEPQLPESGSVPEPVVVDSGTALCDWACIQCESGGNPQAVSSSGTFWGLYQFDYQTWTAHGGNPDTYGSAGASEQHTVAARITYDAWPNC
jgi:hypothetical protein